MSLPLEQKSALVTGSSRGIGRAVAERLALDGAAVVINYMRSRQQAEEAMDSIAAKGGRAIAIQADISEPADVRRLFDEAEQALGCLDIVVANAGVFLEKPLTESTEEDYDYVFNINTRGVFFTLQEAARRVRDESHHRRFDRGHEDAVCRQRLAVSRQQSGGRAIRPLALARDRAAQHYGERPLSGIHRYGDAQR